MNAGGKFAAIGSSRAETTYGRSAASTLQGAEDYVHRRVDVVNELAIPESQDAETARLQQSIAGRVPHHARVTSVLSAVDLDNQTGVVASEVDDEIVDGHLATKMVAFVPQQPQSDHRRISCAVIVLRRCRATAFAIV
jgi:hypothetical protein